VSGKRRDLTTDEKKLWRRVAAGVKTRRALPPEDAEPAERSGPATRSIKPQVMLRAPAKAKAEVAPSPQNRGNEKRVRRGKLEIGGSLDLHGHTQVSGRAALMRFLQSAQRRGDRTVIIITGVGRGGEGVMKRRLPEWLAEHDIRPFVSGFAPAHRSHGGAGAFYVFLKRARDND
jgi:DNA-nicking Smr family endonuclease